MWKLTVRTPEGEPHVYPIKPGINSVGRMSGSDVYVEDISASRFHAEIFYDPVEDKLTIRDLNSVNGTFVNQQRIQDKAVLRIEDTIRIGQCILTLARFHTAAKTPPSDLGTHRFTRELLLESLDHHAVLLYEVSRELNTILDMETALREVSNLMKRSMGAERCEVILASSFGELRELGFPESIAKLAIEQRSALVIPDMAQLADQDVGKSAMLYRIRSALCVPVISGEDVLALIYMYKTDPAAPAFDQHDMQLAVAISHQAALTIQRTRLIADLQNQQQMQHLLRRFLSPQEADFLLKDYLEHGNLPELEEQTVTVLFADIEESTSLAERLGAQRFGRLLARFYQETSKIIFAHAGLIKLVGDGVMAVFGATGVSQNAEERAVISGLEIIDLVKNLTTGDLESGFVIGVGINTGQVMAGYVGSQDRVEYAVLGDTVNVAYRLQELARPNRVVLGPDTVGVLANRYLTRPIGEVTVRGREKSMQVYEVLRDLFTMPEAETGLENKEEANDRK
jgi:adenylate cyclase